mgnify:CR=1 FL=1|tara:strand:+ start:1586 stop:2029 length:444 start_codon:yes stop_codon:yes gene_type:complete
MAGYKRAHQVLMNVTADLESYRMRRDMFDGNETATRVRILTGGTIDPYTEEITSQTEVWEPLSGILGTIKAEDELLGLIGGRLHVGDAMVTYHYDTVSGVFLQSDFTDIELVVPGVSGFYHVHGHKVNTVGGKPMFLRVGLSLDSND